MKPPCSLRLSLKPGLWISKESSFKWSRVRPKCWPRKWLSTLSMTFQGACCLYWSSLDMHVVPYIAKVYCPKLFSLDGSQNVFYRSSALELQSGNQKIGESLSLKELGGFQRIEIRLLDSNQAFLVKSPLRWTPKRTKIYWILSRDVQLKRLRKLAFELWTKKPEHRFGKKSNVWNSRLRSLSTCYTCETSAV